MPESFNQNTKIKFLATLFVFSQKLRIKSIPTNKIDFKLFSHLELKPPPEPDRNAKLLLWK
jgi:hypothetical protein